MSKHIPCELQAILHIFSHDDELRTKALPFVNADKQQVDWSAICRQHYGSGHSAAVAWAYCLWRDTRPHDVNPFDMAFSMDAGLRRAVLRAIAIRWSIPIDGMSTLKACA